MRNIRVVFAVLSLSVVLVAGVADELQAQEKRQGWIKRLRYRRELRRELQGEINPALFMLKCNYEYQRD